MSILELTKPKYGSETFRKPPQAISAQKDFSLATFFAHTHLTFSPFSKQSKLCNAQNNVI